MLDQIETGKLYKINREGEIVFVEKVVEDKYSMGYAYVVYKILGTGQDWEYQINFTADVGFAKLYWKEVKHDKRNKTKCNLQGA